MSEIKLEPMEVDEQISEVVFNKKDKPALDTFLSKLEDKKAKATTGKYSTHKISLAVVDKDNMAVVLYGVRMETKEECQDRISKATAHQKYVEEQELKEYMRLKRKYGKNE